MQPVHVFVQLVRQGRDLDPQFSKRSAYVATQSRKGNANFATQSSELTTQSRKVTTQSRKRNANFATQSRKRNANFATQSRNRSADVATQSRNRSADVATQLFMRNGDIAAQTFLGGQHLRAKLGDISFGCQGGQYSFETHFQDGDSFIHAGMVLRDRVRGNLITVCRFAWIPWR